VSRDDASLLDQHGEISFTIKSGDVLSIHGQTGEVFVGSRPVLGVNENDTG
jgi:hypothetical protein